MTSLSKSYGATVALRDVSLRVSTGTIHAVLGENGAGKSTLVKILTGVTELDEGEVRVGGRLVSLSGELSARQVGIATVFQELSLIPDLTVAENILIDNAPRSRFGWFSSAAQRTEAKKWLRMVGLGDLPTSQSVSGLPLPIRQRVEIAKALAKKPKILILDEATASLPVDAVHALFEILREFRDNGLTMIFISHRMHEIDLISDDVTVLRDGQFVETFPAGQKTHDEICSLLAGRDISQPFPPKPASRSRETILSVENLSLDERVKDVSFELGVGEVLGIGGLDGHGQKEVLSCIFGTLRPSTGLLRLRGEQISFSSPADAIAARDRVVLVPEDRKMDGLLLEEPVSKNICLTSMGLDSPNGIRNLRVEKNTTDEMISKLSIKLRDSADAARSLSGGNQQKVLLARTLAVKPGIVLLVDPTRGIDVGTKQELYQLVREIADSGTGVIFLTTDYEELVGLCDRVLIMFEGQVKSQLVGEAITEENIISASMNANIRDIEAA